MILADNGRLALTRDEMLHLGSNTLPLEQSTPGRQFEHPELGLLEYQERQGEYWIVTLKNDYLKRMSELIHKQESK